MPKFNFSINNILIGVAVVGIIITGVVIYTGSNPGFSFPGLANIFGQSDNQIAKNAVDYINKNGLSQTPATLSGNATEASGLVKFKIKIGANEFDSWVTKDGKLLFPSAIAMETKASASSQTTKASTAADLQKTDKPMLEAYVVSNCPYGLQMQRAIADAVKNVPSLAQYLKVRYMGSISNGQVSSMHDSDASGKAVANGPEAKENLRQICIREEQPTKYWNYVSCYMKKASGALPNGMPLGDTQGCLVSTGVDTAKLNSCMTDPSKGLAYAKEDFDLAAKYNVQGSPTLILGDATIDESGFGGRSSDGVKSIVCAASKTQPGFCSTKLNTVEAAASFSDTYESAAGAANNNAANCAPAQ